MARGPALLKGFVNQTWLGFFELGGAKHKVSSASTPESDGASVWFSKKTGCL